MSLQRLILFVVATLLTVAGIAVADVVVLVDGSQMSVQQYEVKGNVVVITTADGKLRSIPRSYVDLEATERLNRSQQTPPAAVASPPSASPPPAAPPPSSPAAPEEPSVSRARDLPPSVWTHDELAVSLVIPSADWQVQDMVASFDIAVQLEKQESQARATLALIRRSMRTYQDFQAVVGEIETSASATASYRLLGSGPLDVGPYTAHELRFVKVVGEVPVYNRVVAYYSADLAYVLSLACPESRLSENRDDFEALVRGVVIKKSQTELTPSGKPAG